MTTTDIIENITPDTVIQHGPGSDRIYLMSRGSLPAAALSRVLHTRAARHGYSKVTARIQEDDLEAFVNRGYNIEAMIPGYYSGESSLFIVTSYLNSEREYEENASEFQRVLQAALSRSNSDRMPADIEGSIRECTPDDVEAMAGFYRQVFPTYPFPIFDPEYLLQTMREHIDYYCVEKDGIMAALASAEIDYANAAAEMTDFATLPRFRARGFASRLLDSLESSTRRKGIQTFYTIARAISCGMNITFAKAGYRFGGRLKNNTNISGQIESMNVWYKHSTHS